MPTKMDQIGEIFFRMGNGGKFLNNAIVEKNAGKILPIDNNHI